MRSEPISNESNSSRTVQPAPNSSQTHSEHCPVRTGGRNCPPPDSPPFGFIPRTLLGGSSGTGTAVPPAAVLNGADRIGGCSSRPAIIRPLRWPWRANSLEEKTPHPIQVREQGNGRSPYCPLKSNSRNFCREETQNYER